MAEHILTPIEGRKVWDVTAGVKLGKILLIIVVVFCVGLLFRYGTLSPCGMLKKEARSQVLQAVYGRTSPNVCLGPALTGPIDSLAGSLTPMQCAKALYELGLNGENILSDELHIGSPRPS